jgi:hypothetical protein
MKTRTRTGLPEPHADMAPLISSYQDGLTTPAEVDFVERHMLECDLCHSFYGGLQEVRDLIANLPWAPERDQEHVEAAYAAVMDRTVRTVRRGQRWTKDGDWKHPHPKHRRLR